MNPPERTSRVSGLGTVPLLLFALAMAANALMLFAVLQVCWGRDVERFTPELWADQPTGRLLLAEEIVADARLLGLTADQIHGLLGEGAITTWDEFMSMANGDAREKLLRLPVDSSDTVSLESYFLGSDAGGLDSALLVVVYDASDEVLMAFVHTY